MAKTLLSKLSMAASILATSAIIGCAPTNYDVGKEKAYRETPKTTQGASESYDANKGNTYRETPKATQGASDSAERKELYIQRVEKIKKLYSEKIINRELKANVENNNNLRVKKPKLTHKERRANNKRKRKR